MMETYPLSLALFDFIPVTLFLVGAYFLVRVMIMVRSAACGRMAMAAALLIFMGGFLKALWKILYTTNVADWRWMGELQFVLVAPGFFGLLIAAIYLARAKKKDETGSLQAIAIATWKIPLLALMTLASMGANGILVYFTMKRGARLAAVGFIIAFLCLVGMGAMASGEQTIPKQWIEEAINAFGQFGFAFGSIMLHRNVKQSGGC